MKNRGYTLIELLAVIVVLTIVSVIAVPTILDVVEKVRKGSAESSAYGYINAIEMQIATDNIKGVTHVNKDDYTYDEITVKTKGKIPTSGLYALVNGRVTEAAFCINGYYVTYDGNKARATEKCNGDDLKLTPSLILSENHVSLTYPNEQIIDVLENTSDGALSCETSDLSVATCEILENKIKIKSGKKEDNATITVLSEGNSRYKDARVAVLVTTEEGILSVTANGYNGTYDGNSHGITVTSSGATIKYGEVEGTYNLDSSPTLTDIGTKEVYYQITKEGYKTVTGSKTITIYAPPSCTLQVTNSGVSFANKSGKNLSGYGMNKTGTAQYNSTESMPLSKGTFYGYVMDEDGNERNCSVTVSETIPQYTKVSKTCNSNTTYSFSDWHGGTYIESQCTANEFTCDKNHVGEVYVYCPSTNYYRYKIIGTSPENMDIASFSGQRCYGDEPDTSPRCKYYTKSCENLSCSCNASEYEWSTRWVFASCDSTQPTHCDTRLRCEQYYWRNTKTCNSSTTYSFGETVTTTGETECTANSIACDSSHTGNVGKTNVTCEPTPSICSSGYTKLNDSYCYKVN